MPATVNGIGTSHFLKRNLETRQGICTQCGTHTELKSYDTFHVACLVFIPIIPLGKHRIMSHCKSCDRFLQMPWKDWDKGMEILDALLTEGLNGPSPDREKVLEALAIIYQLQAMDVLDNYLERIYELFYNDEEVVRSMAAVMLMLFDFERAHTYSVRAFELDPSDNNRELVGLVALNTNKLDEARAALQFIINQQIDDKYELLHALVEAYQTQGLHEQALAFLDVMAEAFPHRINDKETRRLEKLSNKHSGTNNPLPPKGAPASMKPFQKVLAIAIVLIVAGVFCTLSFLEGTNRDIYFINGLPTEYSITIDGDAYTLAPAELTPLPLGDGTFTVHLENDALGLDDFPVSVNTNFFTRLFSNYITVVNPDTCALILWENIPYAEEITEEVNASAEEKVHFGSNQYHFSDIDYPFEELPDEISTDASGIVMKEVLTNYTTPIYSEVLGGVLELFGEEAVFNYLQLCFRANPMDEEIHYYAVQFLSPQLAVNLLEPQLEKRLDNVNYHRYYQGVAESVYTPAELLERYEGYQSQYPDNSDLLYLVGRITPDLEKANALYRHAFESPEPSAWAVWAYTYNMLNNAQFEEALQFSLPWVSKFPDNPLIAGVESRVAMATKQYDIITRNFERELMTRKDDVQFLTDNHYNVLMAYILSGNIEGSEKLFDWLKNSPTAEYKEIVDMHRSQLLVEKEYMMSNGQNLAQLDAIDETIYFAHEESFLAGNHQIALPEDMEPNWEFHIYQGLSALLADDASKGSEYFNQAADLLSEINYDHDSFAKALRGQQSNHAQLRTSSIEPSSKVLLLIALAYINEEERTENAQLADALNYSFNYPQFLIQAALDDLLAEIPEPEVVQEETATFTIEDVVK